VSEEICEVIITAPDAEWLANFAKDLVDRRLCAAAHNSAIIRSIYRWKGDVYDEREARVALHTRLSLVPSIVELTDTEHPYEVPCVVALPVVAGNPRYIQWVLDQTDGPQR